MTTKSRVEQVERELRGMRGQRSHEYRRPSDGARLVLGAGAVIDAFFRLIGGEPSGLSPRAKRFLRDVPVHSRMSDVEAYPILGDVEDREA